MNNNITVIFDMDGVIVDSEPLQVESFNQTLERYDVDISNEDFKQYVGKKQSEIFALIKKKYGFEESIDSLIKRKREKYLSLVKTSLKAMPGLKELVRWLKDIGITIGIASSSPLSDIEYVLKCIQLDGQFDAVLSAASLERGKPHPDVFLLTAEELDVDPKECVVLEDSRVGVLAAKRANMTCFAIPNFFTREQDFSEADYVVDSLYEVKNILENMVCTVVEV